MFPQANIEEKVGMDPPPDALIMGNLETSLATAVDKARGNVSGAIVERSIKRRASKIFGHPVYSLGGPGTSLAVSGPYEDFSTVILVYG